LEETAPYDPFTQYVFGAEQFSRFARFWTRGYDVYTPTKNIVYHDYVASEHGIKEWFKQRRERIRAQSLVRTKTFLGISSHDGVNLEVAHANLGIYGLGKRRTLKQLEDFVGIDLAKKQGTKKAVSIGVVMLPFFLAIANALTMTFLRTLTVATRCGYLMIPLSLPLRTVMTRLPTLIHSLSISLELISPSLWNKSQKRTSTWLWMAILFQCNRHFL